MSDNPFKCAGCGIPYEGDERVCGCPTGVLYRNLLDGTQEFSSKPLPELSEVRRDVSYLQNAEAHADEGPLGEVAARSILRIALRYAGAALAKANGDA